MTRGEVDVATTTTAAPAAGGRARTLHARLVRGTAAATAGILVCAGAVVYLFLRSSLLGEFDRSLETSARAVGALVEEADGVVRIEPQAELLTDYTRDHAPDYYAAWLVDGTLVAASPRGAPLPCPGTGAAAGSVAIVPATLPDGARGRQATLTFVPPREDAAGNVRPGARVVTLAVARHTAGMDRKLARLLALLAGAGVLATLSAAAVMSWVVRRGLRPLQTLARRIGVVGLKDLGERVELSGAPGELAAVVGRLNELLDRVESTVARERQFTADVAHELRTPLAGLGAILDVCATRRRTAEEYERALARCSQVARAMHVMVENLMTLARADARQLGVACVPVDLGALVRESWTLFEPAAAHKELAAVFQFDDVPRAVGDADKLRIVLNNLLDNAVAYADAGGWMRVQGRRRGDAEVELVFSNSGSRLSPGQVTRAFDRFWRGDEARTGTGVHCGLGLSLCKEIVELLRGRIEAAAEEGGVFVVRLILPRHVADSPAGVRVTAAAQPAAGRTE